MMPSPQLGSTIVFFLVFSPSVFQRGLIREIDEEAGMLLEIVAGPLKGEERRVCKEGATVGRATENTIRYFF